MPATDTQLAQSLKQSAANRLAMEKLFGIVPLSVLRLSRGEMSRRMLHLKGELVERAPESTAAFKAKREKLRALGQKGCASNKHLGRGNNLGLSTMPAELVDFFIKYYAARGQTYIDPFMAQGVQMQVAKIRGLHYYGYDLCREFFAFADAVRKQIDDGKTVLKCFLGDSKHPDGIPDDVGDFSFHSPPYWDIEYYGDDPEQLGRNHSYDEFLQGLQQVMSAWLPKFKRGATHVVNINDFRKDGRFYAYHSDYIALAERAGWRLHDTWIIDGLVCGLPKAFAVDFNMKKIAPKVHEYALVFRKP